MRLDVSSKVVMMDIDGTIKDLARENTAALVKTMQKMGNVNLKFRGRIVLSINRVNMYLVKTGLFPTNRFMQSVLLLIYSILLLERYSSFKRAYLTEYNDEHIFFDSMCEKLEDMHCTSEEIYLVTKNVQNKNITDCFEIKNGDELIIETHNGSKFHLYKSLIEENSICKDELIIVGDNFWDDVLPAIMLGVDVVWCNMYNCIVKNVSMKVLRIFSKKVISQDEIEKTIN